MSRLVGWFWVMFLGMLSAWLLLPKFINWLKNVEPQSFQRQIWVSPGLLTAVTLQLFDLAPENTTWAPVTFIIFFCTISSNLGSILNISVMSSLADIADEHELKTGRHQEGISHSARTFFAKVVNGIGHVVAGLRSILLDFLRK